MRPDLRVLHLREPIVLEGLRAEVGRGAKSRSIASESDMADIQRLAVAGSGMRRPGVESQWLPL